MLYDGDNSVLQIEGVSHMQWRGGKFRISPRPFSALAFRIRGNAAITVAGKTYHVGPDDILYLPQRLAYTAEYSDTDMLVIHFVTAFDDAAPQVYTAANPEKLHKSFRRAQDLWQDKAPGYVSYIMAQIYNILGQVCEGETVASLPSGFLKAIAYINANFRSNNLSVPQICQIAGISATSFRALFRKQYQKTPVVYITELRLEHARNLISGGMSIEDAAAESGFNDPKYFARTVKKHLGCTPSKLRTYGK